MTAKDNRLFINAVLWIAKTGAPWRDLPERFGPWGSVWKRFDRWARKGVWKQVFETLQGSGTGTDDHRQHGDPSPPTCRRGGKKGGTDQALGRSRGGFSTKLHMIVDALGNPVDFILTGGEVADVTQAEPLMEGREAGAFIADKGYDSDAVVTRAKKQGA